MKTKTADRIPDKFIMTKPAAMPAIQGIIF